MYAFFARRGAWQWAGIFLAAVFLQGCTAKARLGTVVRNESIDACKYFYLIPTGEVSSSSSGGFVYGVYGTSFGLIEESGRTTVNPGDVISGFLVGKGLVRLPELVPELAEQTMIVSYGESGKGGGVVGIVLQVVSAKTHAVIFTCEAESTYWNDAIAVRTSVVRCLKELFPSAEEEGQGDEGEKGDKGGKGDEEPDSWYERDEVYGW